MDKYTSTVIKKIDKELYSEYKRLTKYKLEIRNKELFEEALKREVDRLVRAENAVK